jgi:hypothetical protein
LDGAALDKIHRTFSLPKRRDRDYYKTVDKIQFEVRIMQYGLNALMDKSNSGKVPTQTILRLLAANRPELHEQLGTCTIAESDGIYWELFGFDMYEIRRGRKLFITAKSWVGIGPEPTRPGDIIYGLVGGDVPFVLRETETANKFTLIGESYVDGTMYGELFSDGQAPGLLSMDDMKKIILV